MPTIETADDNYTIGKYKIDQSTCSFSPILPQKIIP
jgi:hypothetical protein